MKEIQKAETVVPIDTPRHRQYPLHSPVCDTSYEGYSSKQHFIFHGFTIPSVTSKAGLILNSSLLLSPVPLY